MICRITTIFVLALMPSLVFAENGPNPFGEVETTAPNPFGDWEDQGDWEQIIKESEAVAKPQQDCPNGFCPTPNTTNIEPIPDPTIRVNSGSFTLSQPGTKSYWAKDENGNQVHVTETFTTSNWVTTNAPVCPRCGGIQAVNYSPSWVSSRPFGIRGRLRSARARGRRPIAEIFGAFSGSAARSFARW